MQLSHLKPRLAAVTPMLILPTAAQAQADRKISSSRTAPVECSIPGGHIPYLETSLLDMAGALSKLDLKKGELEKDDEFEKRKRDMVAALKLPNFKLGKRKYLVFVVP